MIDNDFIHLFSSWFNRGFLVLRRIDWSTSAAILEKIIRYEAVHEIQDWDELRRRIDPPDRRCYAFFHPALVDEPLIFVEVALTREIPGAIAPILSDKREPVEPQRATTAVFYSITNCQRGLAGVTLRPLPDQAGGRRGVARSVRASALSSRCRRRRISPNGSSASAAMPARPRSTTTIAKRSRRSTTRTGGASPSIAEQVREPLLRAAAWYYVRARNGRGLPVDSVARFHLGNGARLERLDWLADTSERALKQSYGLMVNYLYDLDYIERNHEAYAQQRAIVASSAVTRLVTAPAREIVPVSG